MQNQVSFVGLLKESTEYIREHRSYRGAARPMLGMLLRKELTNLVPQEFDKYELKPIEAVFLSIVMVESDICIDLLRHLSRFWSDSYEESVRLQIQLENSFTSGSLSRFAVKDSRDRFKIKAELTSELFEILIPGCGNVDAQ